MKLTKNRKTDTGLPSRCYLKSGSLYYVHRDNRWENLGKDIKRASEIAKGFNSSAPISGTMGYWLKSWLVELAARVKAGDLAIRTEKDYKDAVEKLDAFFGKMEPSAIRPAHVGEYLDIGRESERGVRANREKAALSSCFTWLLRLGVVDVNVCKGIRRNPETKRDRFISDDEYHAVYDLCSPAPRCWMVLIYRTLQRPADILAWTDKNIVERDGVRMLEFRQSKTSKPMTIVMNLEIEEALKALQGHRKKASAPLVPTENGTRYTEGGLSSMFRRHVVESKVPDFALYDIKAKGATDMFASGVSLETICALCGHESITTTEIYIKTHSRAAIAANSHVMVRKKKA